MARKIDFAKTVPILFVAAGAFAAGWFSVKGPVPSRLPAAAEDAALNSYDQLPCPDQQEFDALTQKLKFTNLPDGELCDQSRRGKLARALKLFQSMAVDVPDWWRGGAVEALRDPIGYMARYNHSMGTNFSQVDSIAYNANKGDIKLGALFFEEAPLSGLATLIHESHHSVPSDPGHTMCRQGDYAKTFAYACDQEFCTGPDCGSYAYHVSYQLGLAKLSPWLSKADRAYLVADGLSTVALRFNFVPEFMAVPIDVIAVLTDDGRVSLVHPFLKRLVPFEALATDLKFTRIESDPAKLFLYLYTADQKVYLRQPFPTTQNGIGRSFSTVIPEQAKIRDMAFLPGEPVIIEGRPADAGTDDVATARMFYVTAEGEIDYLENDPETGKKRIIRLGYQPGQFGLTEPVRRLVHANYIDRYALTDRGSLYLMDGHIRKFTQVPFVSPDRGGWVDINGGVVFDELFGVSTGGRLYRSERDRAVASEFVLPRPMVKYREGTNFRVALDDQGTLYVRRFQKDREYSVNASELAGRRVIDFAVIRNTYTPEDIVSSVPAEDLFKTHCGLVVAAREPWLQRGYGLDAAGTLVFEGDAQELCLRGAGSGADAPATSVQVKGSVLSRDGDDPNFRYSQVYLELKGREGKGRGVLPYSD